MARCCSGTTSLQWPQTTCPHQTPQPPRFQWTWETLSKPARKTQAAWLFLPRVFCRAYIFRITFWHSYSKQSGRTPQPDRSHSDKVPAWNRQWSKQAVDGSSWQDTIPSVPIIATMCSWSSFCRVLSADVKASDDFDETLRFCFTSLESESQRFPNSSVDSFKGLIKSVKNKVSVHFSSVHWWVLGW